MTKADKARADNGDNPSLDGETRWRQVAQRHHEPGKNDELVTDIVLAVADAEGVDMTELRAPPLYEVVDVVGIEKAFFGQNQHNNARPGTGTIEFHYAGYLIKVRSDGWVQVHEPIEQQGN
ncbi:HalOD1 output domain-containing protein [Halorubrum sp. HHNYT27]|uniref:HalOD1 output domain-containing protein n=1 Tax=Halorubrum sp. HHNYT27 TaxID=3402275 RepID=UPI003EBC4D1A